jgi:hypothetical protein
MDARVKPGHDDLSEFQTKMRAVPVSETTRVWLNRSSGVFCRENLAWLTSRPRQ